MTVHQGALLVGLVGVPIVLLRWAHGLRRRSTRSQRAFWGAVAGHLLAIVVVVGAAVGRPVFPSADDTLRGVAAFWALGVLPAVGALVTLRGARDDDALPTRER